MTGIVIPDGGTIGSTSDTDAISVASNGEVTVNESIKATTIKHTNGTTAITINSDGSLSGKFEGAMKFVGLGKVAINTSGTEGVDYPSAGKTWIVNIITAGVHSSSGRSVGFGQPSLMLSRNSNGDWLQDDGSYSSTTSTSWISRQPSPDDNSSTTTQDIPDTFASYVGQEGISGNAEGDSIHNFALAVYTFEIDTVG